MLPETHTKARHMYLVNVTHAKRRFSCAHITLKSLDEPRLVFAAAERALPTCAVMGYETPDVGVADCTDNPGLPKSSKFCLEGRPYTKLPGLDSAMTTGDMRGKIDVRTFSHVPL
jgi:hypothetical protein